MQRITLAARPGAAPPDDRIARHLFCNLSHSLIIAQRVKIVLVKTCAPRRIEAVCRRAFAEVGFDRADAHLQQVRQQSLIPLHRLRVAEVENRIFKRQRAALVAHDVALVDGFFINLILGSEVSVLPETDVKALLFEIGDHLRRVAEARGRELIVAAPVGLEPAGVQVYHVGRNAVLPQLRRNVAHFVFGFVSNATHPQTERPERRYRTAAR